MKKFDVQFMLEEKKVQLIFQNIEKEVLKSTILGKGEASVVYKVKTNNGTYALKTALYPKRKKKVLQEVKIRKFFIENGLDCVPSPICSDEVLFPNGAVIYEFVEGSKPDFSNIINIKKFARIVCEIHKIEYEIIDDGYSNIEKQLYFLRKTIKKITKNHAHLMNEKIDMAFIYALEEYKEKMNKSKDKFTIGIQAHLHGDLSDNFVIDPENKIWLLDWENSEYGDVMDEICWFLYVNDITPENREIFFKQYQKHFPTANKIKFGDTYLLYFSLNPIFNICWGINQLDMNIEQKLEPERKLRDLAISANNWKYYFSGKTSTLIIEGIKSLAEQIIK